VAMLISYQL